MSARLAANSQACSLQEGTKIGSPACSSPGARVNIRTAFALAVLVAGSVAAAGQQAPQPEPPPVFRVQVDAIELDAFVTDAQGNPVTDLTADDFEILEDGRPQAVTS